MTTVSSTKRPRRSEVRADILAAATAAFLDQGYRRTNVARLAEEAGYTKGAVYSNFGGKPELFGAVMAEQAAYFADQMVRDFDGAMTGDDPRASAVALLRVLSQRIKSGGNWPVLLEEFRILASEDEEIRKIYSDWRIGQRDLVAAMIRDRRHALGLPEIDSAAAANLLMMLANVLPLEVRSAPSVTTEEIVDGTLRIALLQVVT